MCYLVVVLGEDVLTDDEAQHQNDVAMGPPTIPSFPRTANEGCYMGSRFQGPTRVFPITDSQSYERHLDQSRQPQFAIENAHRILPVDACKAIRFFTGRASGATEIFWRRQLAKIQVKGRRFLPVA